MTDTVETSQSFWLETPDGQTAMLTGQDVNGEPQSIPCCLGPGERVWRAPLKGGKASLPGQAHWLATIAVYRPGDVDGDWSFELLTRDSLRQNGLPEFSARTASKDLVTVKVWVGQRGRWEARWFKSQQTNHDTSKQSVQVCETTGCSQPADETCRQCGRAFCNRHGRADPEFLALCDSCIASDASAIAGLAVLSNQVGKGIEMLRNWAEPDSSNNSARTSWGLLFAEAGEFTRAEQLVSKEERNNQPLAQILLRKGAALIARDEPQTGASMLNAALQLDANLEPALQAMTQLRFYLALDHMAADRVVEATNIWEEEFARDPLNPITIHDLGIINYWAASRLEAKEQPAPGDIHRAEPFWHKTIAFWAAALSSSVFWSTWRAQRQADAGLVYSDEDIAEVKRGFQDRFLHEFRDLMSDYESAGRALDAKRASELEVLWLLEMRASELLGNSPIVYQVAGWPNGFGCGPLMLDLLTSNTVAKPIVVALRKAILSISDSSGQKLKHYFSPMARYHLLLDENHLDQAIAELTGAATVWPEAKAILAQAYLARAQEMIQINRWGEALGAFEQAQASGADLSSSEAAITEACMKRMKEILDASTDYQAVVKMLQGGIKLASHNSELHSQLANVYHDWGREFNNKENYAEAVNRLRDALQYGPNEAPIRHSARIALTNLGLSIHEKNKNQAIELLKEALTWETDEETSTILSNILFDSALELAQAHKRTEAITAMVDEIRYDPKATFHPTESDARQRLGNVLLIKATEKVEANNINEAIEMASEARQYYDDSETRKLLAVFYFKAGRIDDSLNLLKQELKNNPSDQTVRRNIGQALYSKAVQDANRNNLSQAIDNLKEALNYDSDPEIRDSLIALYMRAERFSDAATIVREDQQRDPDNKAKQHTLAVALHNIAMNLMNREEWDQAINYFVQALQIENEETTQKMLAQADSGRGIKKYNQGDRWGGIRDVEEALKHDPYNSNIQNVLNRMRY